MKIIQPELMDYDTYEPLNGATEFESSFADNKKQYSSFCFYEGDTRFGEAVKMLDDFKLPYSIFYKVTLETEEEFLSYPIFALNFGSEPGLIYETKKNKVINKKKIKKQRIGKCYNTGIVVMDEKMKKLFEQYCKETEFYPIFTDDHSREYYAIGKAKELTTAPIHRGTKGVEEVPHIQGMYRDIGYVTHIDFHEEAFHEIKEYNFAFSRHFEYNGTKYPMATDGFWASGEFAIALQKTDPKNIQIYIPTLNNI